MKKEIGWLLKEKYKGKATKNFGKDILRLKAGEPLDYVIGFKEFGVPGVPFGSSCKIDLSKKPLIPRPETEFWAEKLIAVIRRHRGRPIRCLDLFSGSGCVGIAVLKNVPVLLCDMADSQNNCIKQIKINCKLNKINKKRYRIIKSDIFSKIKPALSGVEGYDYIFANPPYIPKTRKSKLPKSVVNFEPKEALFAGNNGLYYIRKFLKEAPSFVKTSEGQGKIFLEFSPEQKKEIEKLLTRQNFLKKNLGGQEKYKYSNFEFHRDQYNRWRWVIIEC